MRFSFLDENSTISTTIAIYLHTNRVWQIRHTTRMRIVWSDPTHYTINPIRINTIQYTVYVMNLGCCTYVNCSLPQGGSGAQCSSFERCVPQAELMEMLAQSEQYEQNYSRTKLSTSKVISTPSPCMKLDQCTM